jgi:hypothetical protein
MSTCAGEFAATDTPPGNATDVQPLLMYATADASTFLAFRIGCEPLMSNVEMKLRIPTEVDSSANS